MHLAATALVGGVCAWIFIIVWCAILDGTSRMSGGKEAALLALAFLGALCAALAALYWLISLAYHGLFH
jgi:hypothetical protein